MAGPKDIDQLQRELVLVHPHAAPDDGAGLVGGIGFRPQADVYRTDDPPEIHIILELPGVEPERLEIVAGERTISIAGVRERPKVAAARVQQMELEYGPFQRQLQLIDDVDSGRASATYERGLLRIVLPIAPAPPPPPQERTAILVRRIG